jgi:hypothetical protein
MTTAARPAQFSRTVPLVSLLFTGLAIALHHWYAMSQGEIYPSVLLFLSLFAGLAFAGSVHPPLFYSLGKYGEHLPMRYKVISATCALATFGIGLYLMIRVY